MQTITILPPICYVVAALALLMWSNWLDIKVMRARAHTVAYFASTPARMRSFVARFRKTEKPAEQNEPEFVNIILETEMDAQKVRIQ